jgi:hypothetical protein
MKWASRIIIVIILGVNLWYGLIWSGFEPWRLVDFELGTGIVRRIAPDVARGVDVRN